MEPTAPRCGPLAPARAQSTLSDAVESVRSFLRAAPSPRALWESRRNEFATGHAILPSTATPGKRLRLTLQAWDRYERLARGFEGSVVVESTDPDADVPDAVRFDGSGGVARAEVAFGSPGIHYLAFEHPSTRTRFVSNPVDVREEHATRLYWGDIHLHSQFSDGAGSIRKGLRFGRDVMDLDVVAYTDHDTMGFFIPPSLQRWLMHRRGFERMKEPIEAFDDPGEFVTLFGYEWTKQPNAGGHVNVYFDSPEGAELFDSRHPESRTYEDLWARLREWREETGRRVVTIPHHPAEAMYPFDFAATDYDDELAPLVEIYSQWGSSELPAAENPKPIGGIAKGDVGEPGHYARDALELGNRVGFLASSDYHGPHPGHSLIHAPPHLPRRSDLADLPGWGVIWRLWDEHSYPGGLVAFHAPELTREAIFGSLETRSVYGTTQPHRILVRFSVNGLDLADPSSVVTVDAPDAERRISVTVAGTAPVSRVEVIKNAEPWRAAEGTDDPDAGFDAYVVEGEWSDAEPVAGMAWDADRGTDDDAYYVRVRQADGGMAWAGPIWVAA